MKYVKRLLFFIPVAFIHLVSVLIIWARLMISYAKYGGESLIYMRGDQKMIHDIYTLLKDQINTAPAGDKSDEG